MAFPTTRWTLILSARSAPAQRCAALGELFGLYWRPLFVYARRKGLDRDAAADAVQGLYADLLARDFVGGVDRERGRFRGYLRASMDHHLANLHERRNARKRGAGIAELSIDFDVAEAEIAAAEISAEEAFDREWALGVLERAVAELRREFDAGRRSGPLDAFLDLFGGGETQSYAEAASARGMTVSQFKAFLHRTRARFRELCRREIEQTVGDDELARAELAEVLRALAG
jgi:RNA polymerase sigma-70 factor (ECF subfamily)